MNTTTEPTKNPAAQALGRLGGAKNTPAQQRARKRNAQKAGRPRRVCTKCAQPVIGGHADRALDATCGAHGWRWERAGVDHPAPVNRERAALDAIADVLAVAVERNIEPSFDALARIVRNTGRKIRRASSSTRSGAALAAWDTIRDKAATAAISDRQRTAAHKAWRTRRAKNT